MKIQRIKISNFRGIEARDATIGSSGAIARGKNGSGKTSILRAIRAALNAQDISADAIRNGADRAEIMIDLDDISVRRAIGPKSSSVTVTSANGFKAAKPQTFLTELLGTSTLDPLDLFLAKPKDRRALILAAMPVAVSRELLAKWVEDPAVLSDPLFSTEGHGLEVVARLRQLFYDRRTYANKVADDARREAERLSDLVVPTKRTPEPLEAIDASIRGKRDQLHNAMLERKIEAENRQRQRATIDRIAALRKEAEIRPEMPSEATVKRAISDLREAEIRVAEAENALQAARQTEVRARELKDQILELRLQTSRAIEKADESARLANELEASMSGGAKLVTSDATIAEWQEDLEKYEQHRAETERAWKNVEVDKAAKEARAAYEAKQAEADRLDAVVKKLTNDAPKELLATCKGIEGLSIEGDDVRLDGVSLDGLCGKEQIGFAIEVARRANAKSKILIVDGLERVDPEQLDHFVKLATRDGYQLIGTRVDRGDVVLEAIEADDVADDDDSEIPIGAQA